MLHEEQAIPRTFWIKGDIRERQILHLRVNWARSLIEEACYQSCTLAQMQRNSRALLSGYLGGPSDPVLSFRLRKLSGYIGRPSDPVLSFRCPLGQWVRAQMCEIRSRLRKLSGYIGRPSDPQITPLWDISFWPWNSSRNRWSFSQQKYQISAKSFATKKSANREKGQVPVFRHRVQDTEKKNFSCRIKEQCSNFLPGALAPKTCPKGISQDLL